MGTILIWLATLGVCKCLSLIDEDSDHRWYIDMDGDSSFEQPRCRRYAYAAGALTYHSVPRRWSELSVVVWSSPLEFKLGRPSAGSCLYLLLS
ncbi:hypothetical protein IWW34DRAFT_751854 [Fusarium oxysporum f. sp. albedinis]|nr:hypothetical protein IWW34DRAFT_751854 [Fusarium oxysporum f. sp. albedinis]